MKNSTIIRTIGGYEEVGKNMTVVEYGDEAVILDMGLYMDRYIALQDTLEEGEPKSLSSEAMIKAGAIPDDRDFFKNQGKKVKAIVIGHGHLDHLGAVHWLAGKYNCPILASPYTLELLKLMAADDHWQIRNQLIPLNLNSKYKVSRNLTVEFIYVTHSILQSAIIVVHTPDGMVVYTPDTKFDYSPTIGQKTNIKRLKEIGKEGALALIVDCTRDEDERHTFSESVARDMLKDVMAEMDHEGHAIIVTTFSSHLPRLKSIIDFSKSINRKPVLMGRSLNRYIQAAENLGLVDFTSKIELVPYFKQMKKRLTEVNKDRGNYVLAVTGNQGEPDSVLSKMSRDETPFSILAGDFVIFSCNTIPTPLIIANRKALEDRLKKKGARLFKEIHVSGHMAREDIRDLIEFVKPKHIIPAHGDRKKLDKCAELAIEMGYKVGKNIHISYNKGELVLTV